MQNFLLLKLPMSLSQKLPMLLNLSPLNLICLTGILFLLIFIVNQIRDICKLLRSPRGRNRALRNLLLWRSRLFQRLVNLISSLKL